MGAQSVRNRRGVLLSTVDHSTSSNLRPISAKSDQFRVKKFKIIFQVGGLAVFRRSVFPRSAFYRRASVVGPWPHRCNRNPHRINIHRALSCPIVAGVESVDRGLWTADCGLRTDCGLARSVARRQDYQLNAYLVWYQ